jgi:hypothetical protein
MEEKKEGFFIEKILFKHKFGSETKYLIKWEGYSIDKSTWESESNLKHVQHLLDKFEQSKVPLKDFAENNSISKVAIVPSNPPNETRRHKKKKYKSFSKLTEEIHKNKEMMRSAKKKKFDVKTELKKENKLEILSKMSSDQCTNMKKQIISETDSSLIGSFSADLTIDIPSKVITMKLIEKSVCCLVEWEVRPNGITPDPSFLPADFLKDNYPLPLIEFYESNIRFIEKNN